MRTATELVSFDQCPDDPHRPTSTPIYQTATFEQDSALEFGRYDYSRSGNPTRDVLQAQLARLERADHALAYASGVAAIAAVARLVEPGGQILAGDDLYGGTYRLLSRVLAHAGIGVEYVDTTDPAAVAAAITHRTRLAIVETPTNPLHRVTDLRAVARVLHSRGVLLAVDNTMLSPLLQRPLELGADLVIHSATKHLSGHGDVTAGVVATRNPELAQRLAFTQNAEGTALAPFDSWLLLRGLKTLSVRLERQQATARRIAAFLASHPLVRRVHYIGLPSHPGHDVHAAQSAGPGSVLAFETGSLELSRRIAEATRLLRVCVSFGSVGSSISLPCRMSHASIPADVRRERLVPEDLVRLSIGIEDADDLLNDLEQGLSAAANGPHSEARSHAATVATAPGAITSCPV